MKIARPILRYHGGKWKLAQWIIAHFPMHRIYTEAYGGAASVLLQKPRSHGEVYNDLWSTVVNVFAVMRDPDKAARLREQLRLTPYAREEFERAYSGATNDVEQARRTILRSFAGFGSASTNGEYATGFRSNSNRSGTTPAQDWMHYPDLIPAFVDRLRGVTIENRPALEVLALHDSPETLHYIDPPYPHTTRNMDRGNAAYAHEMTDSDHRDLGALLCELKGFVIVSGYPNEMYDRVLFSKWRRESRVAMADGARKRVEVLWISPNVPCAGLKFD